MKLAIPIGIQEYQTLRLGNYYTIDKTMMIAEFLERRSSVTLVTRPRRFGKTLNMSMMATFFDITNDAKALFEGLAIMDTPYAKEMNQYPVIFLSFANCKGSFEYTKKFLFKILKSEYKRYHKYFNSEQCDDDLKAQIQKTYLALCQETSLVDIASSIQLLCEFLFVVFKKKPMIFIDEYDTPFIEAHIHGYYDRIHDVLASLLHTSLKGNEYLQYGMLTGIQRVAKENIFSDLNNLVVCTVRDKQYAPYFGFTKAETATLLEYYGLAYNEAVKAMYDGYRMGNIDIYNPWSIINYADNADLRAYWVNTSSNTMIKKAMDMCDETFTTEFEYLLEHAYVDTQVLLETSFYEQSQTSSLWGLFVNAGYMTIEKELRMGQYRIRIPNNEVKQEFINLTTHYMHIEDGILTKMFYALENKHINSFVASYKTILANHVSYYDTKSENSFHMFMLGMSICLTSDYEILSNQEQGHGRVDFMLKKKHDFLPNIVMEFKYKQNITKEESLQNLANIALQQIKDTNYVTGLQGETLLIGLAHHKKNVEIAYEVIKQS